MGGECVMLLASRVLLAVGAFLAAATCMYLALEFSTFMLHFISWVGTNPIRLILFSFGILLFVSVGLRTAWNKRNRSSATKTATSHQ